MFFSFAEKSGTSFLSESNWGVRMVAVDSSRRYVYYSAPLHPKVPSPSSSSAESSATAVRGGQLDGVGRRSSAVAAHSPSPVETKEDVVYHFDPADSILKVDTSVSPGQVVWKQKLKVTSVEPVMTSVEFSVQDPHLHERDLFRLRIRGFVRPIAAGETPPLGPLLCESAEATPQPLRLSTDSDTFMEDPFLLKELYTSLHEQFEAINRERAVIIDKAQREGKPVPEFSCQTIDSPRKGSSSSSSSHTGGSSFWSSKKSVVLRCREEREFRRLWYVLQTVLGYDKLIVRPYRGLPPFDPRNGICFAHIPIYAWHTFQSLDKAVFYTFTPGSLMHVAEGGNRDMSTAALPPPPAASGRTSRVESLVSPSSSPTSPSSPSHSVSVSSAFLCVTHDMVLVMRSTGNIPCWIRLQDVRELQYSLRATSPFVVFLTDGAAPDIIFVPQPPVYGPNAQRNFNAKHEVLRISHVIHESWFAARGIRRVIQIREVMDESLDCYLHRLESEQGTRLQTTVTAGYRQRCAVSCPLPKEQLGAVWHEVQTDLRSRVVRDPNGMAIPVYYTTAEAQLKLTPDELVSLQRQLAAGRTGQDDIVGVPLELIHHHQRTPSSVGLSGARHHSAHVEAAVTVAATPADGHTQQGEQEGGRGGNVLFMSPTVQLLHTPQLMGNVAVRMQRTRRKCHSLTTGSVTSERSGYYTTYANYTPGRAPSAPHNSPQAAAAEEEEEDNVREWDKDQADERRVDELMEMSLTAHRCHGWER